MAGTNFNYERAASAVAELQVASKSDVAEKYGVSRTTVYRWEKRAQEEEQLQHLVAEKRERFIERWADKLTPALKKAVEFIEEGLGPDGMDPTDPQAVRAANGSAKILSEIRIAKDVLDAKREQRRPEGGQSGAPIYEIGG